MDVGVHTLASSLSIPSNSVYKYYLFIYIDGSVENDISMQGSSLVSGVDICGLTVDLDYNNGEENEKIELTESGYVLPQELNKADAVVTYNSNGASSTPDSQEISYTFDGWYFEETFKTKITEVNINDSLPSPVIYAKWNLSETVTLPLVEKEGFQFKGWYSDSELKNKVGDAGDVYEPETSVTLYARWYAPIKTVYLSKGTGVASVSGAGDYEIGTLVTITATLEKNYEFTGWTGTFSSDELTYSFVMPETDVNMTANAFKNVATYLVSYNANGGSGTIESQTATENEDFSIAENTFTKPGYTFDGWTTNSDGTDDGYNWTNWSGIWTFDNGEKGISNDSLVLYARWRTNKIIIKYNVNGGTVQSNSTSYTFSTNESGYLTRGTDASNVSDEFHKVDYSTASNASVNLINYNYTASFIVLKAGYTAISGGEWICTGGDCVANTTYNHSNDYNVSNICDASNGDCTAILSVNWEPTKVFIKYSVNGGSIQSNSTSYTFSTNELGYITRATGSSAAVDDFHKVTYGTSGTATVNLIDYNYTANFLVSRVGYTAVSSGEWKCIGGDCVTDTVYNQNADYKISDFCDATNAHCTVVLGVNWELGTYTVTYDGNMFNSKVSGEISGLTVSYDATNSYLTLNGTQTSTIAFAQALDLVFNSGDQYLMTLTHISGNITKNASSSFGVDVVSSSGNSHVSTRNYASITNFPVDGSSSTTTLIVNSAAIAEGIGLHIWLWVSESGALVFDNYKIKVNVTKVNTSDITYGATYGTMPTPVRTGYTFSGWYTGENGTGNQITESTVMNTASNHTLYAKWNVNTYALTISVNNSSYGKVSPTTITVAQGTTYSASGATLVFSDGQTVSASVTNATGYTTTFTSWSSTSGTITAATTITATFSRTVNNYYLDLNWTIDGSNNTNAADPRLAGFKVNGVDQGYTGDYYTQVPYGTTWEIYGLKLNGTNVAYSASGTVGAADCDARVYLNTLNVGVNNTSYGSVSATSLYVKQGTTYSTNGATFTLNDGRTITASVKNSTGYTTTFSSWSSTSGTITAATTITATFSRTVNNYYLDLNWSIDGTNNTTKDGTRLAGFKINGVDQGYIEDYYTQVPYGTTWQIYGLKLNGTNVAYSASGTVGAATCDARVQLNTLNIGVNNSSYGSVSATSLYVKQGTTFSTSGATLALNDGRSISASVKNATGYTTTFSKWSSTSGTITAATTITATFTRTTTNYNVTYNYNLNQSYSSGQYVSTGYKPNWDKDFTISSTFKITSGSKRYLIIGNYDGSDTKALSIEVNTSNALRVYMGTGAVDKTGGTVAINQNISVVFTWTASSNKYTITATGTNTNISFNGTYDMSGTAANALRIGTVDCRGSSGTFNPLTVSATSYKIVYAANSTLGTLPTGVKEGYTFKGWYTATSGGTKLSSSSKVTGNQTIYAQWSVNTLTINYYSNYATTAFSGAVNAVGANKNVIVRVWDTDYNYQTTDNLHNFSSSSDTTYLARTGYTATGYWGSSTSGGTTLHQDTNFASASELASKFGKNLGTGNVTLNLYAQWTANTYTVKYNGNGNTGGSTSSSSHTYGTAKALTANGFVKQYKSNHTDVDTDGDYLKYTFDGWATSASGAVAYSNQQSVSNLTSTNGGTVNLYAKWSCNRSGVITTTGDGLRLRQGPGTNYAYTDPNDSSKQVYAKTGATGTVIGHEYATDNSGASVLWYKITVMTKYLVSGTTKADYKTLTGWVTSAGVNLTDN